MESIQSAYTFPAFHWYPQLRHVTVTFFDPITPAAKPTVPIAAAPMIAFVALKPLWFALICVEPHLGQQTRVLEVIFLLLGSIISISIAGSDGSALECSKRN